MQKRNAVSVLIILVAMLFTGCIEGLEEGAGWQEPDYGPPSAPPSPEIAELEMRTHFYVNQHRLQQGVDALEWNNDLATVARIYSRDMAENDFFSHEDLEGRYHSDRLHDSNIYYFETSGENLLYSTIYKSKQTINGRVVNVTYFTLEEFAIEAAQGWMDSPGHRENMLRPQFDEAGMGIAVAADNETYYFTQLFIKRAVCGYLGGPCCMRTGYLPSCYIPYQCVGVVCT